MTRNFEVQAINGLSPAIHFPVTSKSTMLIIAFGIFEGETAPEAEEIMVVMEDLAVNSAPFATLLAFIFGNKGLDKATQFFSPNKLLFNVEDDKNNPGSYILKNFSVSVDETR